ncbi:ABC-2 type transporter-domain-containing protein [Aspergillus cavernicola]|uniref:ABC-2 type transporter-domain-containing protein n=1 Tax=Aspergillus cavernicola TaxID=176166 RepID=A0ABR4I4X7_9EURO
MDTAGSTTPMYAGSLTDVTEEKGDEWHLTPELNRFHARDLASGFRRRELGVSWEKLTVRAISAEAAINENALSQFNPIRQISRLQRKPPLKTILDQSHGCVKPGEMLLVLGRPGSGCTTLLKMLANRRRGYQEIHGKVFYGSMSHKEAEKYQGQIIMNSEEEIFFPTLSVGQTMTFATRSKVPAQLPSSVSSPNDYHTELKEFLLHSLGISHTANTKVGNEYVRGVSGGERKRVSIAECLASRGSLYCWDNSTRGLDASSALDWAKAIRAMTDVYGLSTIVTLYQAGNHIYDLFDKVLILDEGKQIFYGPMAHARPFMEQLGFSCEDGANIADFLTGVTVPTERQIRRGFEAKLPRDAEGIRNRYYESLVYKEMAAESSYAMTDLASARTADFQQSVALEKATSRSQYTVGFSSQVWACIIRQYQIIAGDMVTFAMKQGCNIIQALVAGSLYYQAPDNSSGIFLKGGVLFWSVLYNSMTAMSEVVDSFTGRPVILKHKSFAYIHPAAICIAQVTSDIPILLLQVSVWSLITYFMAGLTLSASAFFTYWIVLFVTNACACAMFRAIGAVFGSFNVAAQISGYAIAIMAMYAGYQIQATQMHPWFSWLHWLNPLSYGFEALLGNEFHLKVIECVGNNLIPSGDGYDVTSQYASCAGVGGSKRGDTSVSGDDYLASLSYSHSHVWRNFGILCAWWVLFIGITVIGVINWRDGSESGAALLIPREKLGSHQCKPPMDEESQATGKATSCLSVSNASLQNGPALEQQLVQNTTVFTWNNLTYTVQTPSGPRVLLDQVYGWVKPGTLTALMGSSGAGKTTLLDVLAQRKTDGTIRGSILVDGYPLPVSFQRSAAYTEQLDIHEPYATVREALQFSALLRQSRETPNAEKLNYVEVIINLLELHDIADSLVGKPGTGHGLSVEQRKRLTIGVELVSKPKILIFLDEPTSGLDGQSAFNTIRFLRKLADAGQSVLVTIHQPSAQLFSQFDRLLLLKYGGKMVYFGDIGKNCQTIKEYFGRYGAPCPPSSNPAEHMLDVVSGHISNTDWHQVWLDSPECRNARNELEITIREFSAKGPVQDDGYEYAMPLFDQTKIVLRRMNLALFRNTSYINNKIALHIGLGLFNGFSYWKIGETMADLQLKLFTVFVWMFVAPGVINQLQPLFIERRDLYDAREKKARIYSWKAFVTALILSEMPYLCVCAVLYFVTWYYTVGFSAESNKAGAAFFIIFIYEFLYTSIGQFIAAYAPNAVFAALANPLLIGCLVSFCGILVPYPQIVTFWRYWMYWLNPTTYLVGSMLTFTISNTAVHCTDAELSYFNPPDNSTCAEYLSSYLRTSGANLLNPGDSTSCRVCPYTKGSDYLETINIDGWENGWRDAGITIIFIISSYGLVYLFMALKTKSSKRAE